MIVAAARLVRAHLHFCTSWNQTKWFLLFQRHNLCHPYTVLFFFKLIFFALITNKSPAITFPRCDILHIGIFVVSEYGRWWSSSYSTVKFHINCDSTWSCSVCVGDGSSESCGSDVNGSGRDDGLVADSWSETRDHVVRHRPVYHNSQMVANSRLDWLSKVYRPTKNIIGHIGNGFLRVKWPNHQCQSTEGR